MIRARLLLVAATAAACLGGAGLPVPASAALPATHVLTGAVIPDLTAAAKVTPRDTAERMVVGVALQHADPAGEAAAAAAVNDPANAAYRHFYTPASWAARFGLPAGRYQALASQLTANGLSVGYAAPTRDLLLLSGTVAQVERTFAVQLNTYTSRDGRTFHANAQAPTVPDGVVAVQGLEDVSRTLHKQGLCVQGTCAGAIGVKDLWTTYDLPATNTGTGEKVAIIGEGATDQVVADLRQFETENGLPRVNVRVVNVLNDGTDVSGMGEWDLDSQASTGMAPGVDELAFYFSQSLSVTSGAFSAWANDPAGARQANASFGGCESLNIALGNVAAEAPILQQAAAEGRTTFVSTGDTGGSCTVVTGNGIVNTGAPQVEWPAASPWVVAVGGTMLYTDGTNRILEKAWEYTGGGVSISQPRPTWQAGANVIKGRCVVDGTGNPQGANAPCRGLPDVAALSGDVTTSFGASGLRIVSAGADSYNAGTSLSSPLWAGMWTRINAAAPSGLGFAAPLLYGVGNDSVKDAADFYDIALGGNGQFTALPRGAAAPNGWDYVSGLGVPDVRNVMQDLAGSTSAAVATSAPSVPDTTGVPTWLCGPNGVIDDPAGDSASAGVEITRATLALSGNDLVATFYAPTIGGANHILDFSFAFHYLGKGYSLLLEQQGQTGTGTWLNDATGASIVSGIGGGIDRANGLVTISIPVSQFNSSVNPDKPLGPGSQLVDLDANTNFDLHGGDDAPAPGCTDTL
jgi:pseudomonalisin